MSLNKNKKLRAIDLCCGAGGWAAAARGLPIEFVAVADIMADCLETWRQNHQPDHPECRRLLVDLSTPEGIDQIRKNLVGRIDIVLGGIPCEQISCLRGSSPVTADEMDAWYRLLDNCLYFVRDVRPRWWAFEDVVQIDRRLPLELAVGMPIPRMRLDAKDFGPQFRKRMFLGVFPRPEPDPDRHTVAECLRPGPHQSIPDPELYQIVKAYNGSRGPSRVDNNKMRVLVPTRPSPTIPTDFGHRGGRQRRQFLVEDERGRVRILDWHEAAIIQGFPEDYLFAAPLGRTCEMIGRAIPIYVGRAILKAIVAEAQR